VVGHGRLALACGCMVLLLCIEGHPALKRAGKCEGVVGHGWLALACGCTVLLLYIEGHPALKCAGKCEGVVGHGRLALACGCTVILLCIEGHGVLAVYRGTPCIEVRGGMGEGEHRGAGGDRGKALWAEHWGSKVSSRYANPYPQI